jgi:hypothetical protein
VAVTATNGTTELMAAQNDADFRAEFWDRVRRRLLAGRARRRRGAAPGHGDRWAQGCGAKDDPAQFQTTRSYLIYARRLLATSECAEAFYRDMLALHPTRLNSGALWGGAHALFPSA